MTYDLGSVKELITEIGSTHDAYSRDFLGSIEGQMLNLRKKDINSIFSKEVAEGGLHVLESSFLELIQKYQDSLNKLIVYLDYDFDYRHLDFRMRIKQKDSIINKLFYYKHGKDEKGGIPLNKCLNDLLGFRIMINDFDHTCEEALQLRDDLRLNDYKMFCYDASKGNYRATHIYFYGDNKYFPWEMQLWNPKDEETNELSHKDHKNKREYITWPQEYNKDV